MPPRPRAPTAAQLFEETWSEVCRDRGGVGRRDLDPGARKEAYLLFTRGGEAARRVGFRVHDVLDGTAHCAVCAGNCTLEGAELAFSVLVCNLIYHEVYSGRGLPSVVVNGLEEIGVPVEKLRERQRAKTDLLDARKK